MANTGAGLGAFGAGLAKSLARGYADKRERERSDARRAEDRAYEVEKLKFSTMLPSMLENIEDVDDDVLASEFPAIFGGKQKGAAGKARGAITSALKRQAATQTQQTATTPFAQSQTDATGIPTTPQTQQAPATSSADQGFGKVVMTDLDTQQVIGEAPAVPRRTLMGVPILTSDEKIERGIGKMESETNAKVALARRILPQLKQADPSATMDDALAVVGIRTPSATARGAAAMRPQSVRGTINGKPAFGIFDPTIRGYVSPDTGERLTGFTPLTSEQTQTFGVDREAIAQATFGKPFRQLVPAEQQQVIDKEQEMLQQESKRRALGGGQGRFESPIDVKTSQDTGAAVGSSSADYAQQVVPNMQQQTRLRNAVTIKQQLGSIIGMDPVTGAIDPAKSLLKALPAQNELQGLLPGAAGFVRRRLPQYRNEYSQLESAINNIRAALTRTMQSNVGTETEKDAERALSTLADFQGSLMDPAKGDTRESALIRFQETLNYLDTVMATIPALPAPNPPGGAAAPAQSPAQSTTPVAAPAAGRAGASRNATLPPGLRTNAAPAAAPAQPPVASASRAVKDANGNWVILFPSPATP